MVPTVMGGVALEWHRGDVDIEIEFPSSGFPTVLQTGPGVFEIEGKLEPELPTVVQALLNLV
jgi:hypothetical protein